MLLYYYSPVIAFLCSDFCDHHNEDLSLTEGEIPEGCSFDFMLAPALKENTTKELESSDGIVVFCIDISGSMDTNAQIPKFQGTYIILTSLGTL